MSAEPRPVILLEFSDLTPALVREPPNLRRFHDESRVYVTTGEQARAHWVTVHTGLSSAEDELNQKCIWDLASDQGLRVWVCGSPQTRYHLPLNGCVLPDASTSAVPPHPVDLLPYLRLTQVKQRWDLFRSYYRRMRPHLATFFVENDYPELDALVGGFLRLAGTDVTLVLLTAGGLCWIRTPDRTHVVADEKVPLRALAPTVLRLLGVPIPACMTGRPLLGERAHESARRIATLV
ncbi:MAG TPA: hypothetical protein VF919_15725 [Gemmatimonadales bacterium]